ncbi:alpha/beta hydrolase [Adhaeribacter pallidiroseus]|uniref:Arylacetamide deacetylase-like n=1 Tax=Adhaeribacter pallidiroseus TaxID=2072847 RepID=A0A369QF41_9BACT|nr:alpha/beta hydrolase [Adhaeribacter pallidiroseus]RDC62185.1 Arylacetamide deacetylase-like [Adhaeribacter pallidiroseus]
MTLQTNQTKTNFIGLFSFLKKQSAIRAGRQVCALAFVCLTLLLASCQDDDESNSGITPKGPKPDWGPTIAPEMLRVIEKLDELSGGKALNTLTPQQARLAPTATDAVMAVMQENSIPMPPSQVDTMGYTVPVAGGSIHVRSYKPKNTAGALPGIVYYHGGGWVIATINTYDASARALAEQVGAVVVSVEYRKAPENKFPAAHEDAFAAYQWVIQNAATLGINPKKIAVAGESAGGNLAAAVSMMALENGVDLPVHQLLVYPIADNDTSSPSYLQYANAKPLSKPLMEWFFAQYIPSPFLGDSPWISLVDAPDLVGLPSATVINAEIDPLLSEGQEYATKLKAAGVPVTSKVYPGVTHEFFGMATVVPQAKEAQKLAADELKAAFSKIQ